MARFGSRADQAIRPNRNDFCSSRSFLVTDNQKMNPTKSSTTRVRPVFGWLRENGGANWPDRLLEIVIGFLLPIKAGKLLRIELVPERKVAASPTRLAWMIDNVSSLAPQDGRLWQERRNRIPDKQKIKGVLDRLGRGDPSGLDKKLRLEGETCADCLLECEHALVWIEGKRFDWISLSTKWDLSRDQLARNLEAVWILATTAKKDYCVVICHEHPLKHHEQALINGYRNCIWTAGWPHIPAAQRIEFSKRIGTVTWQQIAATWAELRSLPELHDLA